MTFKKKFKGYDPAEVDKYIAETESRDKQVRAAQKERIEQLSDENFTLRQQLKQYQTDEQAISKALISSQNLAQEMKFDAEKYSDLVLTRAKIFYATWRAYAQTLISSLSPQEVTEFNNLQRKIEMVINAYEGRDIANDIANDMVESNSAAAAATTEWQTDLAREQIKRNPADLTPSQATMQTSANPITRIEQAADQAIDLRELSRADLSLEELCAQLGLTVNKD